MKKEQIIYYVGYGVLGLAMLSGVLLLWNARAVMKLRIAEAEEAAKPAEIDLTLITPTDCQQCVDGNLLLDEIQKQNVRVLNSETFTQDSEEGSALIGAYAIEHLPAIIVNGEYDKQNVRKSFVSFGGEERDGAFVIELKQPVYFDLKSGEIVGLVDVTYITDSSCTDCYDPAQHKTILENNFGVAVQSEKTIDARSKEGRALIAKYAILQTPTVLLSSQALAYDRLAQVWKQVGTIEEDGTFIFRTNTALNGVVYKDLETGEIIRPETSDK